MASRHLKSEISNLKSQIRDLRGRAAAAGLALSYPSLSLTPPATLLYTRVYGEQGAQQQMKLVVVGGQARKVGKTSVIAGLIRGLEPFSWTAVKVSAHGARDARQETSPDSLPPHLNFSLREERDPGGPGDTSRFLAAGARRALWLRVCESGWAPALPCLLEALGGAEHVIIESNSILEFLHPAVYLLVTREWEPELKASARKFLGRADALVTVVTSRAGGDAPVPELSRPQPAAKPVFRVTAGEWSSAALCRFVTERVK